MRFASEAIAVVAPVALLVIIAAVWAWLGRSSGAGWTAVALLIIALGLLAFFRDPLRIPPADPGAVVSPADGVITRTETLPDGRRHIVIFLSVLDVHVNRAPFASKVGTVIKTPGTYFHAGTPRAEGNARVDVEAQSEFGPVAWRQVSGLLARKISCTLKPGDQLRTGDKIGLIYFGSRMDVFLPPSATVVIEPGRRVKAGESIIAQFALEDR